MTWDEYLVEKQRLKDVRDKEMRAVYEVEREDFDTRLRSRQATIRRSFEANLKDLDERYRGKPGDIITPGPVS